MGPISKANLAEDEANQNLGGFLRMLLHPRTALTNAFSGGSENLGQGTYKALGPRLSAQGPPALSQVLDEVLKARQGRQSINQLGSSVRNLLIPQLPGVSTSQ